MTVIDLYPIVGMNECFDSLDDTRIITTFNDNLGYWKIKIDNCSKDKLTFTSHNSLYRLLCMTFGLKKATNTMCQVMNVVV